jgi:Icc-related predicted phosphoesterase
VHRSARSRFAERVPKPEMPTDPHAGSAAAPLRIAAAGDVHVSPTNRDQVEAAFGRLAGTADLVLLAGDLTTHGEPEQAAVLAKICRPLEMPIFAVLGNHDWHRGRGQEIAAALAEGGVRVLEREAATCGLHGLMVGVAGVKGFVGGFDGSFLPDFGEPLLREVYAECGRETDALDRGLEAVAECDLRIALLHYAPTPVTLQGEPPGIFAFLGSRRLAEPIVRHRPDLVLHGHAHAGTVEGTIEGVPVFNVSVPVIKRDFWLFEHAGAPRAEREGLKLRTA